MESGTGPFVAPLRNSDTVADPRLQRIPKVPLAKLAIPGEAMLQSPGVCGASRQSAAGGAVGAGGATGAGAGRGAGGGLLGATQPATIASAASGAKASFWGNAERAGRRRGFAFMSPVWNEARFISSMQSHD